MFICHNKSIAAFVYSNLLRAAFRVMVGMTKIKCRTCLKSNAKVQSLVSKPKDINWDGNYKDLLKHIAKLEFDTKKESKMPQGICRTCSKKLRDAYVYIEQIQECNTFFMDMVDNISNKSNAHLNLVNSGVDESPCIRQEPVNAFGDNNLCSKRYNLHFDNSHVPPKEVDTLQISTESSRTDVSVKIEQKNPKEIYPECVISEDGIKDRDISSDGESNKSESSHGDPLDAEPTEESKSTSVEDELLPVRCDECERVFGNSLILSRHKKDTHLPDELKIQCPSCPVKFSRRYNMYAHIRTFHKSETVREHQIQPRKLTKTDVCDQCHRSYSDKYKLMAHIKNKHGPGCVPKKPKQPPKQYLCTLCGLTCTNKSNLEIHYRRRHTGEKPFKCDFCDRCFTRSYEVKVHRRTHTGESPYKCTVCEKAFKRSNKLKIHMRIHTNERPYKCTECEKAFRESKDLNIHRRTHTGERPYKCNVCNSTFTQSNSLKLHQKKKKHFQDTIGAANSVEFTHAINTFL